MLELLTARRSRLMVLNFDGSGKVTRHAERRAGQDRQDPANSTERIKMPVAGSGQRHERTGQRAVVMTNNVAGG